MSDTIKTTFDSHFNVTITDSLAKVIVRHVTLYEMKDRHPEAFNSPYLGLVPCYFVNKDRDEFFALFDTEYSEVKGVVSRFTTDKAVFGVTNSHITSMVSTMVSDFFRSLTPGLHHNLTTSEVRDAIKEMKSVESMFKVASDPFNLFLVYVLHRTSISKVNDKLKHETMSKLIMLLQYKFFTSLVNHRFKYKPNEDIMRAMYEGLTDKYDIKRKGSWKNILQDRADTFLDKSRSIHYRMITSFDDDKKIIYILSDIQTRIRNQVNIVTTEFMKYKDSTDKIGSYTTVGTDIDGDKSIIDYSSGIDAVVSYVYNDVLVTSKFLDDRAIKICAGLFTVLNAAKIRDVLLRFSDLAVMQNKAGTSDEIKSVKNVDTLIGSRVLVQSIIEVSYRYCINNNVNVRRPADLIKAVRDAYGSSRISDPDIVKVRDSITHLMLQLQSSRRLPTLASLRIMFVVYIIILSLKYFK